MKFLMIRHGETSWNAEKKIQGSTDIPLNDAGAAQARALGEQLLGQGTCIAGIYTSAQIRARETARILADKLGLKVRVLKGLEEMSLGLWEGLNWDEVAKRYPEEFGRWKKDRRYVPAPCGESYQDVLERVVPALRQVARVESGDVLIVTHSAVIMSLLSCINDTPFQEMILRYRTQNCTVVEVEGDVIEALQYREPSGGQGAEMIWIG